MKYFALITAVAALAACDMPAISGGPHSNVRMLSAGMDYADVRNIMGSHQAGQLSTDATEQACLTWVYDEMIDAKFIHAIFVGTTLQSASDGHAAICQ